MKKLNELLGTRLPIIQGGMANIATGEFAAACSNARALALRCDVRRENEVQAMMASVQDAFGRIDILVNNAGVTRDSLLLTMKEEDFDAVLDTNLKGTYLCTRCVVRTMMKQRYGRIVNLSSVVALRGNAGQVNYAASKAGIIGLTKSAARELSSRGITVNAVAPGFIDTDMTAAMPESARAAAIDAIPAGRMGDVSASYMVEVMDRISRRFGEEDCQRLEEMLTIISRELMPEIRIPDVKHT